MSRTRAFYLGLLAATALSMVHAPADLTVRPAAAQRAVAIDNDDIGGVVTGPKGPEAGVWVIAETTDLPTNFIKMVVTDDQGRYVIPDLPTANYQVWVRGYGLVDSPKLRAKPGQTLNHTAVSAPNDAAAAHYYPAIYWYSMLTIPPESEFGGNGDIPKNVTRTTWIARMKNVDCVGCHQLGNESTRTIPAQFGTFESHADAWIRRVRSGQFGQQMTERLAGQLGSVPYRYFGDWTRAHRQGRAAVRQAEAAAGRRAQRRGHVMGVVDARQVHARPDLVRPAQSDGQRQRQALRLAGVLDRPDADPRSQDAHGDDLQDAGAGSEHAAGARRRACASVESPAPSAYWGERRLWDTRANNHNAMFDERGRVWIAATIRDLPIRTSARKAPRIRRPSCSRST